MGRSRLVLRHFSRHQVCDKPVFFLFFYIPDGFLSTFSNMKGIFLPICVFYCACIHRNLDGAITTGGMYLACAACGRVHWNSSIGDPMCGSPAGTIVGRTHSASFWYSSYQTSFEKRYPQQETSLFSRFKVNMRSRNFSRTNCKVFATILSWFTF